MFDSVEGSQPGRPLTKIRILVSQKGFVTFFDIICKFDSKNLVCFWLSDSRWYIFVLFYKSIVTSRVQRGRSLFSLLGERPSALLTLPETRFKSGKKCSKLSSIPMILIFLFCEFFISNLIPKSRNYESSKFVIDNCLHYLDTVVTVPW